MTTEQRNTIEKIVREYIKSNERYVRDINNEDDLEHVIHTAIDILAAKWGLLDYYGSFVEAITKNNLTDTFACADETNLKAIQFYVMIKYNVGCPRSLR